jgi:alpha-tubulin suppressor-like RCC1 family protein
VGRGAGADGSNAIAVDAGVQAVELVEDVTEAVHDGAIAVDGGINTGCAVLESGEVCAWGWNGAGQLGEGTNVERPTPAAPPAGLGFE